MTMHRGNGVMGLKQQISFWQQPQINHTFTSKVVCEVQGYECSAAVVEMSIHSMLQPHLH